MEEPKGNYATDMRVSAPDAQPKKIPFSWRLTAAFLISLIGFGSHWSASVTSAMKSTLKRELQINNTQFALIEASEDFVTTILILLSGLMTDRVGGAGTILYGNIVYTIGSIVIAVAAQLRSYRTIIGGRVILTLGDLAVQIAQYKMFSAWFSPSDGFGATLGLQISLAQIGAFIGKATANIIAQNTGDFAWTFWVGVLINLFTNTTTGVFYWFSRTANKRFPDRQDPVTGQKLVDGNSRLEFKKLLQLPWAFWSVMAFSLFQTSTTQVFTQNATEMAEQRFDAGSVAAGWYTATLQYGGFFLVPLIGLFLDFCGNRISLICLCATGMVTSMALLHWTDSVAGTATAFGVFSIAYAFGPTTLIDAAYASLWDPSVFGSAYSIKFAMNNAMNIIARVATGILQDRDDNSYKRVTTVYFVLAVGSLVVAVALFLFALKAVDLHPLQWTRRQRFTNKQMLLDRRARFYGEDWPKQRVISRVCFLILVVLILGSWSAYIWAVVTGSYN